ncbi:hypothetical protein M3Y99_00294000 [Aphelenchoides fujianensis]|nr:hypothetical protein M3Y99_00294000 [Aphelenchoides fujianensis]
MDSFLLVCLLVSSLLVLAADGVMMPAPECPSFCPAFCKGKCTGTEAQASCNGNTCHCGCSATAVGCKTDECEEHCKTHSNGRHYEASCMNANVCKCAFGDPTKDLYPVNYPIPKDAHYDIVVQPE